ncbi:MAG: methyltransferase domain-containing protein [Candidatus Dormibacteraeota bacterium]|nr:methyltransferase domain-containing protein [Candidatus Dormibacteraeota bacterium]
MSAQRWERAAEKYATGEHKSGDELPLAVKFAAPKPGDRVLDIGAGAGHMALAMAPYVKSVVLTDPVGAMLDAARGVFANAGQTNAEFIEAAAETLPFEPASFDIVTSRLAAHHFEDLEEALREIARVLKPSGVFILVDTVAPDDPESGRFLHEVETLRDPTHRHTLTENAWVQLIEAGGYRIEQKGIVRKAHDFEPWLERGGEDAATMTRVRGRFLNAPASAAAALNVVVEGGEVRSFTDYKLVLAARSRDQRRSAR